MRRILLTALVLLAVAVAGAAVFTTTERFRSIARDQLNSLLAGSFRGELSIGRLEGSVWGNLTLVDVDLRYRRATLVHIPRVSLVFSFLPLLTGTFDIGELRIADPEIRAHQDERGLWDLLQAVSSPAPPEEQAGGGLPLVIALESIAFQGGSITATTTDSKTYELRDAALRAHASIGASGIRAAIDRLDFRVVLPDRPPLRAEAALVYEGAGEPATITIDRFVVTTERSRAELTGTLRSLEKPSIDARLSLDPIVAADIQAFAPGFSTATDVRGSIGVNGSLEDLRAELNLDAAEGRLMAKLRGNLAREPSRFEATAEAKNIHLGPLLAGENLAGVLAVKLEASGSPASLETIRAKADVAIDDFAVREWRIREASASAELADGRGAVDAKLRDRAGAADFHGTLGLADLPEYDLRLDVKHLNPAPAFPGRATSQGNVNLTATVEGRGLTVEEMRNEIRLTIRPSTLDRVEIERGVLRAAIADRRLTLRELSLRAEETTVRAAGVVGLDPDVPVNVSYSASVSQLAPWLALAGRSGGGRVSLDGVARGRLADLGLRGKLELRDLAVEPVALERGDIRYELAGIGGAPVSGEVQASFANLQSRVHLQTLNLTATLPEREPQALHLLATATQDRGRSHRFEASATMKPSEIAVGIAALELALPDGSWRLAAPAHLVAGDGAVAIDRFRFVNGTRELRLEGRLARSGKQGLRLAIESFPLESLASLVAIEDLQGLLSANARVEGTAAAPVLMADARATGLRLAGQTYEGLSAETRYADGRARLALAFRQDTVHRLDARGELPLDIHWQPDWAFAPTGPIDLRATSSGIDLAFVNAFGGENVRDAGGELTLDLTVKGPLSQPVPRGTIGLRDARLRLVPLGVRIEQIEAAAALEGDVFRLERLSARARDGMFQASAEGPLRPSAASEVRGEIRFDRWPAIHTREYQAEIGGKLTAGGALSALSLDGNLEVINGTIRPKLDFLEKKPPERDETIVFVGGAPPTPREEQAQEQGAAAPDLSGVQLYRNMRTDLTIEITRNTWIKHEGATVELRGNVHLTKARQEDLAIAGRIETVRGWMSFQGKRFTVSRGEIVLTGGPDVNPNLDVVASHKTGGYRVDIVIGGTANAPTLDLRSQPPLEQADVLSVLLFGKPTSELNEGQRNALGDRAAGLAQNYAISQVSRSVTKALGIEELGVQVEEVSAERVALGKYIGERTYVSVAQAIGTEPGQQVSVEYEITRSWSFVTSSSTTGDSGADLVWERSY